ncbi:MAG: agmatine deiminase family protein [Bacteroidota bacterium]
MKSDILYLLVALAALLTLNACTKTTIPEDLDVTEPSSTTSTPSSKRAEDAQVIVMAAPSVHNDYYEAVFDDIVDFQVDFANRIDGRDEVIILVDRATRRYYRGRVPNYVLVAANIEDIWIRDFAPVIGDQQVKFNYLPNYLSRADANYVDNSFERWMRRAGLAYGKASNLILDGGNVVDNGNGRVIVTDRFLADNPQLTKRQAKKRLKKLLQAEAVAIIKETPGDATGHSDGMVMWADEHTLLLHDQPTSVKGQIIKELERSFPEVEIITLPDYYEFEEWDVFSSACNIYVNALVTNRYIYVPTFDSPRDQAMLQTIQSHTSKEVVAIPAEKVCFMGGSVRCLTWQLEGAFASRILEE